MTMTARPRGWLPAQNSSILSSTIVIASDTDSNSIRFSFVTTTAQFCRQC